MHQQVLFTITATTANAVSDGLNDMIDIIDVHLGHRLACTDHLMPACGLSLQSQGG
jgi:hypothetical protein